MFPARSKGLWQAWFCRAVRGGTLGLLLWVGAVVPTQAVECLHSAAHAAVVHATGVCLWSCAVHDGAGSVAYVDGAVFPHEWGTLRAAHAGAMSLVAPSSVAARAPPMSEVAGA